MVQGSVTGQLPPSSTARSAPSSVLATIVIMPLFLVAMPLFLAVSCS